VTVDATQTEEVTDEESEESVLKIEPFLGGSTSFIASGGSFNISGLEFTGKPTQAYSLIFDSDGVDENLPSNKEYLV